MTDLFDAGPTSSAVISDCGQYRYRLTRTWDDTLRPACFVMLNPSTADAGKDDPTIRRCVGFARSWGCGGIVVVNLFAFRATDPAELLKCPDPVGPDSWVWLESVAMEAVLQRSPVVAAWGVHGALRGRSREVADLFRRLGSPMSCLGVTKDGHPRHPLYVRADAALIPLATPE